MLDQIVADIDEHGLVERCLAAGIRPLWTNPLAHGAGRRRAEAMVWPWHAVAPLIEAATTITSMDAVERRVLSLFDSAYADNGTATTRSLNAGYQILLPGEKARPHRHSMNAIRFVVEGSGATTSVDGQPCPMNRGDLILTPGWTWHDHIHNGSERIVWLDVLDGQLHRFLETDAFEPGPIHDLPAPSGAAFYFPWQPAVETLGATPAGNDGMQRHRYVNPVTGGAVTPLLDCELWQIAGGAATHAASTTAHMVCTVVEGSGTTLVGGTAIEWGPRDVFTLPAGHFARHNATSGGAARIFVVSDREVLRRLDLLVERIEA